MSKRNKTNKFFSGLLVVIAVTLIGAGIVQARPWCLDQGGATRFLRIDNVEFGDVVVDRATNLIWERSPLSATAGPLPWVLATLDCHNLRKGGFGGWRLPTVEELTSIVFRTFAVFPADHPFQDVAIGDVYWTATDTPGGTPPSRILVSTDPINTFGTNLLLTPHQVWCVNGGMGVSYTSTP